MKKALAIVAGLTLAAASPAFAERILAFHDFEDGANWAGFTTVSSTTPSVAPSAGLGGAAALGSYVGQLAASGFNGSAGAITANVAPTDVVRVEGLALVDSPTGNSIAALMRGFWTPSYANNGYAFTGALQTWQKISYNMKVSDHPGTTQIRAEYGDWQSTGPVYWDNLKIVALDPTLSADTTSLNYGSVSVGNFADLTFTITNVGDSGSLISGTPTITGPNAADFSFVNLATDAYGVRTYTVRFTPSGSGSESAGVSFAGTSATNNSTFNVSLANAVPEPASLALGLVGMGLILLRRSRKQGC